MRHTVLRIAMVVLVLALAGMSASCQATKAKRSTVTSAKQTDPRVGLEKKMLILKDQRDMRLAIVRLSRNGFDENHLMELAREMTLGDLQSYVKTNSQASRLVYQGAGRFRLEALRLVMGDAPISEATFNLRLKAFEVGSTDVDSVILEQMVLDGKDVTPVGGLALYIQLLETKMTR